MISGHRGQKHKQSKLNNSNVNNNNNNKCKNNLKQQQNEQSQSSDISTPGDSLTPSGSPQSQRTEGSVGRDLSDIENHIAQDDVQNYSRQEIIYSQNGRLSKNRSVISLTSDLFMIICVFL